MKFLCCSVRACTSSTRIRPVLAAENNRNSWKCHHWDLTISLFLRLNVKGRKQWGTCNACTSYKFQLAPHIIYTHHKAEFSLIFLTNIVCRPKNCSKFYARRWNAYSGFAFTLAHRPVLENRVQTQAYPIMRKRGHFRNTLCPPYQVQ